MSPSDNRQQLAAYVPKADTKSSLRHSDVEKASVEDVVEDVQIAMTVPHLTPPVVLDSKAEAKLYRKIDIRLMPILFALQVFSFMDRGNIGNAKLQGLITQLNLGGNRYSAVLSLFFLTYCLLETPASLVTKKFKPSRWLPGLTITWGVIMTLMGIVETYSQLVAVRVTLGAVEAGLFPGISWYLSIWYPRHMLQLRIGIFWGGAAFAGAFSGLLAFGISFMNGIGGKEGWSWIFIIEGLATVLLGVIALIVMVDFPDTAEFLTPEERAYVIWKKKYDNTSVGEEEHFEFRHALAAVVDWQTWLHALMNISVIGPAYGITFFLPSIINGFGFSTVFSQLLTVPPYLFATILAMTFAALSDKLRLRFPFVLAGQLMAIVGFAILLSDTPSGVRYFGTFLAIAGPYAGFPGVIAWLSNNTAGQYKRGTGLAILIAFGNFAGSLAPLVYRQQDAPRYALGNAIEMMFVGIGILALCVNLIVYPRVNARRAAQYKQALEAGGTVYAPEELRAMGDRSPDFRYTL